MPYGAIPARFAQAVGWRATAVMRWGECARGEHLERVVYAEGEGAPSERGVPAGWADLRPTRCEACEAEFDPEAELSRSAGCATLYDTPSGRLEPGSLYYADWIPHTERPDGQQECWTTTNSDGTIHSRGWTNCTGRHLMGVCPNGSMWDIDGRASNCTLPDDTLHRCWVRSGEPEAGLVVVSKDGLTCSAGAGSIAAGDYHGFLVNSIFSAG